MNAYKTIFISSFNPFILRNILVGDTLKILRKRQDLKIFIFVPSYKKDFFEDQIGFGNINIIGVSTEVSNHDVIFRYLTSSLLNTDNVLVNKKVELKRRGNYPRFLFSCILMVVFSRFNCFKKFIRWIDLFFYPSGKFRNYFDIHKPSLFFATDIFDHNDVNFMIEAKKLKIRTFGMVRSWDNLVNKGIFRVKPDKLIVHNELMKDQAVKYDDMGSQDIFISGAPQYDKYITGKRVSRKDFFNKIGLDSNKKLILFSPFGSRFTDTDWQTMEILREIIDNKLDIAAQVLVRLTPNDYVSLEKFIKNDNFYIDDPGYNFGKGYRDKELTDKDMDWLADCVYHSDVIVTGGASIGIEAAIYNKPTILIYFDGRESGRSFSRSIKRFWGYSHVVDLIRRQAVKVANNRVELLSYLKDYLENPSLDKQSRDKMLQDYCWKLDGLSGKRIADFIIQTLVSNY